MEDERNKQDLDSWLTELKSVAYWFNLNKDQNEELSMSFETLLDYCRNLSTKDLAELKRLNSINDVQSSVQYWQLLAKLHLISDKQLASSQNWRLRVLAIWCKCLSKLKDLNQLELNLEKANSFLIKLGGLKRGDGSLAISDERFLELMKAPDDELFMRHLLRLIDFIRDDAHPMSILFVILNWVMNKEFTNTYSNPSFELAKRFYLYRF